MGINWPKPGINHVGEYQASGHIFVQPAASQNKIVTLEFVAKSITFIIYRLIFFFLFVFVRFIC